MIRCLHLSVLPPFVHLSFTPPSQFYILPAPLSPCTLGSSILSVPGCSFSTCKTIRSIVLASPCYTTAVYSSFLQFSTFLFINCVYLILLPHYFISVYTPLSVCITTVLLHCRLGFWVSWSKWRAACLDNYSVRIKPYWLMLFFLFVL